ncbi:MAG TPA: universal stress protein [Burkholderiales bacterium]|nr:universal stress protein [Burkholderiales bacterium]
MKPFKRILAPVDGSAPSRAGLERAIAFAKSPGARLRLVHVVDSGSIMRGTVEPSVNVGPLLDMLEKEGRRILASAEAVARKGGVRADTVLHEGHLGPVAERIVREAAKWRADVIVMGTHGRRGFGRLVMGSDAESVLRESRMPVLLVKARRGKKRRA